MSRAAKNLVAIAGIRGRSARSSGDAEVTGRPWATSTVKRVYADGRAVYVKQYLAGDLGATADVIRKRTEREISLLCRLAASTEFGGRLGIVRLVSGDPDCGSLVPCRATSD